MNEQTLLVRALLVFVAIWIPEFTSAAPRMISYQYPSCVSCHISPQGRYLLNEYGAGIDEAQSFRASEAEPNNVYKGEIGGIPLALTHDVRLRGRFDANDQRERDELFRGLMRASLAVGEQTRISVSAGGEVPDAPSARRGPFTRASQSNLVVEKAVVHYRPRDGLEFQAGRDFLPSGINFADLGAFVRSRNRMGELDTPTQIKMFGWGDRYQIQAVAFGPGGTQRSRHEEWGGGLIGELEVSGKGNAVVGLQVFGAYSDAFKRQMLGAYLRWGFASSAGILLEHDVTRRDLDGEGPTFYQYASYGQLYWTPYEWLVASIKGEQLLVERPFREERYRAGISLAARWARLLSTTLGVSRGFGDGEDEFIVRVSASIKR